MTNLYCSKLQSVILQTSTLHYSLVYHLIQHVKVIVRKRKPSVVYQYYNTHIRVTQHETSELQGSAFTFLILLQCMYCWTIIQCLKHVSSNTVTTFLLAAPSLAPLPVSVSCSHTCDWYNNYMISCNSTTLL